jgi:acetate kinase|tara:strand:+ start:763 stop:1980 length:1218 start_codon:yes stop_codon:yes gene_type:complete
MNTLVINTGSSSIKYQFIDMPFGTVLCTGLVERIGEEKGIITHRKLIEGENLDVVYDENIATHEIGMERVASLLTDSHYGVITNTSDVKLVGHRVVLGGEKFSTTSIITSEVKSTIEKLSVIAPLHNPPNLTGIHVAEQIFTDALQVAVFDTSFHHTLPDYAYRYALPDHFYTEHDMRVYGFHGTSHQYVTGRAAIMLKKNVDDINLITIHLGNGASITAVKNGKSIDTSMGMTPTPGLVMGTRVGDIDPGVLIYMQESLGINIKEIKRIINKESGLKGLTGFNDVRLIQELYLKGDQKAELALNLYSYRIKKYIGSYLAIIGNVDAIVFTAGVGENSDIIRKMATDNLSHLGIQLSEELNTSKSKIERDISSETAKIKTFVIPTNEEFEIARQAYDIFTKQDIF